MTLPAGTTIEIRGIDVLEAAGSGVLRWREDTLEGERLFFVDWADRYDFVAAMRGESSLNAAGTTQVRSPAEEFPGFPDLLCSEIQMVPEGECSQDDDGNPSYPYVRAQCLYRINQNRGQDSIGGSTSGGGEQADEVIATLDVDFQTQYLAFGAFECTWASSDDKVKDPIPNGKLITILPKKYRQSGLSAIPETAIRSNIGKVNDDTWNGAETGTVLFVGASSKKSITSSGTVEYEITYEFRERPEADWNKFWNSRRQAWDNLKAYATGSQIVVYATADFTDMFNSPLS